MSRSGPIRSLLWALLAVPVTFKAFIRAGMGWMLPFVAALFFIALLLAVAASAGALAPFVYPLL